MQEPSKVKPVLLLFARETPKRFHNSKLTCWCQHSTHSTSKNHWFFSLHSVFRLTTLKYGWLNDWGGTNSKKNIWSRNFFPFISCQICAVNQVKAMRIKTTLSTVFEIVVYSFTVWCQTEWTSVIWPSQPRMPHPPIVHKPSVCRGQPIRRKLA